MIDAHTHLDFPDFDGDRAAVVARARAAGVQGFVIAGADPAHWDRVERVAAEVGAVFTLGLHPWWVADVDRATALAALDRLGSRPSPWGLGELGLDWGRARTDETRALQVEVFRAQLALARSRDVPVVLHIVRAYPDALRLLAADGLPRAGGMVHSWSGSADLVPRAVRLGLHLSFSAAFVRSERLQAALRAVPDDRLLYETDCPDQALDGGRGEPADVVRIAALGRAVRS